MTKTKQLKPLFYPKSIAVIGATNKKDKIGHIIFSRLKHSGARLFPVHPKEAEIMGVPAYPTIESLPEKVDLAITTISADKTVSVIKACAVHGVKAAIIVASGFGEIGEEGKKLEKELKVIHDEYGLEILGPNTLGIFLPETGLDTIFVEHGDKALAGGGSVAFITQSGSVGTEALGVASNTGYGMRAFVGLGNKILLNETDFLEYFHEDKKVNCIAIYAESIDDGKVFLEKAKVIAQKKAIIVLKAGRSAAGQHAVSSHTGKLAGSDRVVNGAFHQYGIQRAFDEEEICDASKTLSMLPLPEGNRVAVITAAGGYGVMCTDYIEQKYPRADLKMAELDKNTREKI
ncbi:MAG: CoA-binding protein, partial [Spirochaetes bacterium]